MEGRLTGLENQDISVEVEDGCRMVRLTVDKDSPKEAMAIVVINNMLVSSGTQRS